MRWGLQALLVKMWLARHRGKDSHLEKTCPTPSDRRSAQRLPPARSQHRPEI